MSRKPFSKGSSSNGKATTSSASTSQQTAEDAGIPNERSEYMKSLQNEDVIERVRCVIKDAHVFKLPPRPTSGGWRGADWRDEVWQGTVKVVERDEMTLVLLVDKTSGDVFAVCPIKDGAVDRCVDSSRYFVLKIENDNGRHMFVGVAFNERNDSFDFNTSLEDAKRERAAAKQTIENKLPNLPEKDYSIKEGEKIRVKIKNIGGRYGDTTSTTTTNEKKSSSKSSTTTTTKKSGGFLKPSSKDTPRRAAP
ncbi:MAG: hypothetical protein ACI8RD_012706 [Bacillariaceae sp.]|jgi:hypothetical protein